MCQPSVSHAAMASTTQLGPSICLDSIDDKHFIGFSVKRGIERVFKIERSGPHSVRTAALIAPRYVSYVKWQKLQAVVALQSQRLDWGRNHVPLQFGVETAN